MKLLDRYIVKSFVKAFLAGLVIFAVSAVALDFFARLGSFVHGSDQLEGTFAQGYSGLRVIVEFYIAYLPYLLKEVLPFITVATALVTVATLLRSNEVFPVLSAGVSVRRLFLPLLLCGLVIAVGHGLFQEFAIPSLNRKFILIKRIFGGEGTDQVYGIPHLRDGKGTVVRAGSFRFSDRSLHQVVIQRPWTKAGFDRWIAPELVPQGDHWRAPRGLQVRPAGLRPPYSLPKNARVDFGFSADDVEAIVAKEGTAELSTRQIYELMRRFPDRRSITMAFFKQLSRPFTGFLLILVGIPALLARGRSRFWGAAIAFVLSISFYFTDIFFTSLGDRGDLPPLIAAFFPTALFLSWGVASFVTVPT